MSRLWDAYHQFYTHEPEYRRIVRALKYFDSSYHIYLADLGHIILHAALESLICTNLKGQNKAEVVGRLPQLVPFVIKDQAVEIYNLCVELKHSAAPLILNPTADGVLDQYDHDRFKSTQLLRDALRHIFKQCIVDPKLALTISDVAKMRKYLSI